MKLRLIIGFTAFQMLFCPLMGQENNPYFAFEESFALSTGAGFEKFNIVTFIPRTYLLFVEDRENDTMIGDNRFLRVLTQDAVEVYVLESTVSDKPFKEIIGDHQIIFNDRYGLCKGEVGCNSDIDENVWKVHRGDAFEIIPDAAGSGIKLKGTRVWQDIVGFVSEQELDGLIRRGVVTRADLSHPKYNISRTDLPHLKVKCGVICESAPIPYRGTQIELADSVLKIFNLGKIDRGTSIPQILFNSNIGEEDKSISFRVYRIKNRRTNDIFTLAAMIINLCQERPGGVLREERIEFIEFRDEINGRRYELDFEDYNSSDTLMDKINPPYLFSVNSYDQYTELIDRLGQVFQDRALAGYFLSEFNRSCRSEDRKHSFCRGHSYR